MTATKRRKRVDPSQSGSKQTQITVYFYPDEIALIRHAAMREGISVSSFVTRAAIEKLIARKDEPSHA